jgi:hypothetical protein
MGARRLIVAAALALGVAGCGVAIRTDRAAIGGGPAQSTAQAQERIHATVVAIATANPQLGAGQPCDCESTGR